MQDLKEERIAPVGGQAVMEGVMMRGANGMALAVRDPDCDIRVETYRLAGSKWYKKIPIVRGVATFISSLVSGMKMLTRSVEISSPEEETVGKAGMAIAMIVAMLFAVGLFIVLPEVISGALRDFLFKDLDVATKVLLHSVTGGVLRIIIFVLYLLLCSRMRDIKRTFMYHGAEHKTINCFENNIPLTIENIQKCSTVHRRCGTTFLFLVMIISILLFALANWMFEVLGITFPDNRLLQNLIRIGIKLALLPLVAGCAYEVLRFFAKLPYNTFTKILMAPGLALQKLTTAQPDDGMVEVALKSFNAAMEFESNPNTEEVKYPDTKLSDVRDNIISKLNTIEAEEAEADWILCHVLSLSRNNLYSVKLVSEEDYAKIKEIVRRRLTRQPLDYILGSSEFYGIKVNISDKVLIPRFDTETLSETAINEIKARTAPRSEINAKIEAGSETATNEVKAETDAGSETANIKAEAGGECSVLDLCTGSGCVALAILDNTMARVTASDISPEALKVAQSNLEGKNCTLIESDLFDSISGKFDIIVSNPPYIKSAQIDELAPEVTCQPRIALDGGIDGLDFYKRIIKAAPSFLNKNGVLLLEIGHDQRDEVTTLINECGSFLSVETITDLSGSDRVIKARVR